MVAWLFPALVVLVAVAWFPGCYGSVAGIGCRCAVVAVIGTLLTILLLVEDLPAVCCRYRCVMC